MTDPVVPFSHREPARPAKPKPKGVGPLGALIALFLAVAILAAGGKTLYVRFFGAAPDYDGAGSGQATVQVEKGASISRIATVLAQADVVMSARAFREAADDDERSLSIQPGYYALRTQMKATLALALLLDPASRIRSKVVIPEGKTVAATLDLIAKSIDGVTLPALQEAAANPAALGLPAYAQNRLEGFLFPATYDVEPGTTATQVLRMMVERFAIAAETVDIEARAKKIGRTPYQILTIASLVEAETGAPDDRGKVSRVAYNRLERDMRLQFDSTVQYALGTPKKRLFNRDLEVRSPYNTYRINGLPPTPINSPGEASLEAALSPTPGPWIYFVVIDKQGNSAFTDNAEEFARLRERYRREVLGQ